MRRDVELARDAGLDLVRVNGHIARPELYEAADELGMLVWQDFPLQWGYARTIRKEAVRQAREAVDLLGHHPSIAVWCAHNEPVAVAEQTRRRRSARRSRATCCSSSGPTWNKTILDRWVKRAFETADETRSVVAHSGVAPHLPQLDGTDSHLFFGWYHGDGRRHRRLRGHRCRGWCASSASSARSRCPTAPTSCSPSAGRHSTGTASPSTTGCSVDPFERHVPPSRYATFDSWRDATQRYQAELLRHHIETLRRLKYRPTGGFCFLGARTTHRRRCHGACSTTNATRSWRITPSSRRAGRSSSSPIGCRRSLIAGETVALDVHVVSDLRVRARGSAVHRHAALARRQPRMAWNGDVPPDSCVRVGTAQFVVPDAAGELWFDLTLEHPDTAATNRYAAIVTPRRRGLKHRQRAAAQIWLISLRFLTLALR